MTLPAAASLKTMERWALSAARAHFNDCFTKAYMEKGARSACIAFDGGERNHKEPC